MRILFVEDNPADVGMVQSCLAEASDLDIEWEYVERLADGLQQLADRPFDAVLLDLNLPDSAGPETLHEIWKHSPTLPVVVLTDTEGLDRSLEAVRGGLADYLVKSKVDGPGVIRAIRLASERVAHHRAMEEVKDAEVRYRLLFEQSPDGIVLYDLETCLPVEFNTRACGQLGYSRDEFSQIPMCRYQDRGVVREALACANKLQSQKPLRFQTTHRTKTGEIRHVLVQAQSVTLAGQRMLHCIFRDDTHRKSASLALQESQRRFRALVETTSDWIWTSDEEGIYTYSSPRVRDLLGYEPEEVLGKAFHDLVIPSEAERVVASFHKSMASGAPIVRLEHTAIHKDGRRIVLETNAAPVFDADRILLGYRGIDRDITEVKEAYDRLREREHRYRQLFAAVTSYAYTVHVENGVSLSTSHGDGCTAVTGYQPEDYEADPDLWMRMIHPDDRTMVLSHVADLLNGEPVPPMEHRILHADQTTRWVRNTMIPHCQDGVLVRYDGLIEDITERKNAERALRDKELQLLAAQKIQERLLPGSSPVLPGFDIAGVLQPAEFAAGDYFDYLPMRDGRTGIVVGDVTGHGFGPALIMASTHVMLRLLVETQDDVAEILTLANSVLVDETEDDRFVTLLFARLDPGTRTLDYSNAGHPPGYVLNSLGEVRFRLMATDFPLGILPDVQFSSGESITLLPGDTVLFLSDGILESLSPEGEFFGSDRTLAVVRAKLHRPAGEIAAALCHAAHTFSGGNAPLDDTTVLVMKLESHSPVATISRETNAMGGNQPADPKGLLVEEL